MTENYLGKIVNGDCIEVMKTMEEGSVDLIVTSPPYGVGIDYDVHDDDMVWEQYSKFTRDWMEQAYRVLKDKFFGVVDLEEESPHRSRTTAWGSWMSPSAPYIYNPKECVILAYKKKHIKIVKGQPEWVGEMGEVEGKDGNMRPKMMYTEQQKREFIDLVFGQWNYFADTRSLTKATFSMDIPTKAIKILTYKNDIVLDPFAGSGTSMVAAETLDRRWIGIELSPNYAKVANERVGFFVQQKRQQVLEFPEKPIETV